MKYSDFNVTQHPFVYIKINPLLPTAEELKVFFDDFEKLFVMTPQSIVIFNTKEQKLLSSESRIQVGKWLKDVEKPMNEKIRCIFFTESSIWLQMVLKAIFLITTPPVPIHVVSTLDDVAKHLKKEYRIDFKAKF